MRKLLSAAMFFFLIPAQGWAADEGLYFRGDIGAARYENTGPFPDPGKLGLGGGYRFSRNFAVDVGLTFFGRSEFNSSELMASSLHPSLVGILPLSKEFSAIGKLGVSRNHAEAEGGGINFSHTRTDVYYGLGASYDVNSRYGFTAMYENYGKFDNSNAPMKASAFSIGVIVYLDK